MDVSGVLVNEFTGHKDAVYVLLPSAEENTFFSSSGDGMIVLWNIQKPEEGKVIARLPSAVYSLLFLHEKNILVAGTRFGGLYFLDVINHKQLHYLALESDVFAINLVKGNTIVSAESNGNISFISTVDFSISGQLKISGKSCRYLALHPTKNIMAAGCSDNFIRLLNTETREIIREWEAHKNSVFSLSYSPNGRYLFSGGRDALLNVFDSENNFQLTSSIAAHWYTINDIQWKKNSDVFATSSRDKTIKLWDAAELKLLMKLEASTHSVNKIMWQGSRLLSAGDDRKIRLWDIKL